MKRSLILFLGVCVFAGVVSSEGRAEVPTFSRMAFNVVDTVWKDLGACGLIRVSPYDPRLPRPQVPADYAITNRNFQLLAYYREESFGWPRLVFKAPNGGQVHAVTFTEESISFSTPYAGTVAQANRYYTVEGPANNYLCHSQYVDLGTFERCVYQNYVRVIANQLCRYGTP